jgi:ABC-type molybdate transport system substrate-binding protein
VVRYPIASVKASARKAAAEAFVELVRGPEGQKVLGERGFRPAR